jgi:hypothetical protein
MAMRQALTEGARAPLSLAAFALGPSVAIRGLFFGADGEKSLHDLVLEVLEGAVVVALYRRYHVADPLFHLLKLHLAEPHLARSEPLVGAHLRFESLLLCLYPQVLALQQK